MSAVLVLCWASGFVVPRAFEAYAEPLTFVALRNGAALVILSAVALALRSPWPRGYVDLAGLLWSGAFLQGLSLSLMYWSVYHGIPVAIAALVGGLQPVVTALIASQVFDEALSAGQWLVIVVGFAGVALVVAPKLGATAGGFPAGLLLCCLLGVVSIAYGTLQQKRFERTGRPSTRTAVMFAGALVPPAVGAAFFESPRVIWSPEFLVIYAWSTLALAIGATMALLFLVRRGAAARATSFLSCAARGGRDGPFRVRRTGHGHSARRVCGQCRRRAARAEAAGVHSGRWCARGLKRRRASGGGPAAGHAFNG
ncbi:MAG TPA: DMT family transporter [Xanthobacteraceae bacterium]|nr:DMT family transporter [Xanthobacteraceae bacterium]